MILESNLPQQVVTQSDAHLPKTSYAYRTSCLYKQKLSPEAGSCESSTNVFDKRIPHSQYTSRDIDISVDKLYKDPNIKENELLSLNRIQGAISQGPSCETQNSQSTELKIEMQPKQNQKIERWRLNPLDVLVDEKDVPLPKFERPMGEERAPFSFCNNRRTSQSRDKIIADLSNHLEEVAELWCGWQRTTTDTEFQWGAPIKVGSANGSLKTKYISSKLKGSTHQERERTYKRKASTIEAGNLIHCDDDEDYIDNDEDNDSDELIFVKKKKSHHSETRNTTCEYPSPVQEPSDVLNSSRSQEWNESQRKLEKLNPRKFHSKNQTNQSDETASTSQYPRRIVPPNPTLKRRGPQRRKDETHAVIMKENIILDTDEEDTVTIPKSDNRSYTLSDQEPVVELEKNHQESQSTEQTQAKSVSSSVNRMTNRLQEQCMRLRHLRDEEETKKREDIESLRRQEEEARRHRVEVYKKYVEEKEEKSRREEDKRKEENEKTERWRRRMKQTEKESRERDRKINDEELKKRVIEEEMLLRASDGIEELHDSEDTETDNRISCPICNKTFPTEEIENHAAACEQYNIAEVQEINKVTSYRKKMPDAQLSKSRCRTSLECQICLSFSTNDGNEYENHVHGCLENQKKRLEDDRTRASSSSMVLNVPTSPIRCFVPISQQRDCEINYRAQFSSTNRQSTYSGRKRKRKR
ncbi:trichohyalin isoform X2 [Cephus cinctus]|nr:trichohyalin isoform X2 [Cephus cinctus]